MNAKAKVKLATAERRSGYPWEKLPLTTFVEHR